MWTVSRAQKASTAQDHSHGEMIAKLVSKVYVFSLPPGFFFLAEAANWWGTAVLPCARIAAVDCFLTNRFGDSPRTSNNYLLFDADYGAQESLPGLRTNRGGQFVFQAAGALVIESDAASLPVHLDSSVRDLYAIVQRAPSGNAVTVSVKRNGELLHTLSIDAGRPFSNPVSGAQLPTLREGDRLSMDIDGIGSIEPGRDLTVVVRI